MKPLSRLVLLLALAQVHHAQTPPPPPTPDPTKYNEQPCQKFNTDLSDYDWVTYDGITCYSFPDYYYGVSVTWHEARDNCLKQNATLASIHSYDINYLMSHRKYGTKSVSVFWIGMNSLVTKGQYKWSDGSPVDYTNFSNKTSAGDLIPTDIMSQGRCGAIRSIRKDDYYNPSDAGKWFKEDCNTQHPYVCEKRLDGTPPPTEAPKPVGNCSAGWYKYANEKCVQYLNYQFTHDQAQAKCIGLGGHVLAIHSAEEQNFITALIANKPEPFIGLTRPNYYQKWSWGDQTSTTFTNWGVQDTSYDYSYNKQCVYLVTNSTQPGKWIRIDCKMNKAVICEKDQDSVTDAGLTLASKCKIPGFDNFIQYGNSCYSIVDSDQNRFTNFSGAEDSCRAMNGAHLLSIVDPFEQIFFKYYIKQFGKSNQYWIGLQSKVRSDSNVSQVFEWTDDWPVYITDWNKGEPLFPDLPQEECVFAYKDNGTWRTDMCVMDYPYICKTTSNPLPKLNQDKSGVCPQLFNTTDKSLFWVDLDRRSDRCYWFSVDRKGYYYTGVQSWSDASFHCRRRNGTLVSIHSTHEIMLLKSKLNQTGTSGYNTWIGLAKNYLGEYAWEDGTALDFTNWDPNEKIVKQTDDLNQDSSRQCVESAGIGAMWKQQACIDSKRNYFICQTKKIYSTHVGTTASPQNLTSNPISEKSSGQDLSGGAKAGIAFGVIAGVVAALAIGFFVLKRYRPNSSVVASFENSLYRSKRKMNSNANSNEPPVAWSRSRE